MSTLFFVLFEGNTKQCKSKVLIGVCLHLGFGMCPREACLNLLFLPDVKNKSDLVVRQVVMSFADSSCLVWFTTLRGGQGGPDIRLPSLLILCSLPVVFHIFQAILCVFSLRPEGCVLWRQHALRYVPREQLREVGNGYDSGGNGGGGDPKERRSNLQ